MFPASVSSLYTGIIMNKNKHFYVYLSLAVSIFFTCVFSWNAFAADTAVKEVSATEKAAPVTPPVDYSSPDTYIDIVNMVKDWILANLPHLIVALAVFVIGRIIAKWIDLLCFDKL